MAVSLILFDTTGGLDVANMLGTATVITVPTWHNIQHIFIAEGAI